MGRAARAADPDAYEHQYAHCDVLVIGGGAAGRVRGACRGARDRRERVVILCDETSRRSRWTCPDVTVLTRTTAFGCYDGLLVGALERVTDHLRGAAVVVPRQRCGRSGRDEVVLATGALERGIAYPDNDLPGTMLAGAARTYVERYAVRPGTRAVVFTNNDSAYDSRVARCMMQASKSRRSSIRVAGRRSGALPSATFPVLPWSAIVAAHGRRRVTAVDVAPLAGGRRPAHRVRSRVRVAAASTRRSTCSRRRAARCATTKLRFVRPSRAVVPECGNAVLPAARVDRGAAARPARRRLAAALGTPLMVRPPAQRAKRFVDLQNDVTVDDIALAAREGYQSVEHLKRYTTLGMGTDQGKTSNVLGLALLARAARRADPRRRHDDVPPALHAGHAGRRSRAANAGARRADTLFGHARLARRARRALRQRRALESAAFVSARGEARTRPRTARRATCATNVGIVDVSTLGKIELQDATSRHS